MAKKVTKTEKDFIELTKLVYSVGKELNTELSHAQNELLSFFEEEDKLEQVKTAHKRARKATNNLTHILKRVRKLSSEFNNVSKDFRAISVAFEKEM